LLPGGRPGQRRHLGQLAAGGPGVCLALARRSARPRLGPRRRQPEGGAEREEPVGSTPPVRAMPYLELNSGCIAHIGVADKKVRLVIPGVDKPASAWSHLAPPKKHES